MITIINFITTAYSRDLRYKEMTMMESMIKLPDDMFRLELLPYLTVQDIVNLDNACMNHKYRLQVLDKISGVILLGDKDKSIRASLFKWLGMRRIYLIKMLIVESDFNLTPFGIENDYVDQFRYTQHVFMRGPITDDMAIFIISHCPCLLSIGIGDYSRPDPLVTDQTLQSIAKHCSGRLQSLSLIFCRSILDSGLITISLHCHDLQSLKVKYCNQITDTSIISVSTHCTGLQSLDLTNCIQITDASVLSISTHCTGLQELNLDCCDQISDASIISISAHCTGLQSFNLYDCNQITDASIISISSLCTGLQSINLEYCYKISDASIISISTHCTGLQFLYLLGCLQITDASIIPISENCTGLKELNIPYTNISDASLIAIAKNCTGLQLLRTDDCDSLSSDELRRHRFDSISELRAVLLSIYPSLHI